MQHPWPEPVILRVPDDSPRNVTSVEEAFGALSKDWPSAAARSKPHLIARRACLAALQGHRPKAVKVARAAFVEAAKAARIISHPRRKAHRGLDA
nr:MULTISPECIES: DUF982 domain-containing protein [unclassified Chelatococcus]